MSVSDDQIEQYRLIVAEADKKVAQNKTKVKHIVVRKPEFLEKEKREQELKHKESLKKHEQELKKRYARIEEDNRPQKNIV